MGQGGDTQSRVKPRPLCGRGASQDREEPARAACRHKQNLESLEGPCKLIGGPSRRRAPTLRPFGLPPSLSLRPMSWMSCAWSWRASATWTMRGGVNKWQSRSVGGAAPADGSCPHAAHRSEAPNLWSAPLAQSAWTERVADDLEQQDETAKSQSRAAGGAAGASGSRRHAPYPVLRPPFGAEVTGSANATLP